MSNSKRKKKRARSLQRQTYSTSLSEDTDYGTKTQIPRMLWWGAVAWPSTTSIYMNLSGSDCSYRNQKAFRMANWKPKGRSQWLYAVISFNLERGGWVTTSSFSLLAYLLCAYSIRDHFISILLIWWRVLFNIILRHTSQSHPLNHSQSRMGVSHLALPFRATI